MDYETGKKFEQIDETLATVIQILMDKGIIEKPKEVQEQEAQEDLLARAVQQKQKIVRKVK